MVRLHPSLVRAVAVVLVVVVGWFAPLITAESALAATSKSKQRDVERLQDQIDELNDELSALNEDALEAGEQLDKSRRDAAVASEVLKESQTTFAVYEERVRRSATRQYIQPRAAMIDFSASLNVNSRRQVYLRLALGQTQDQMSELSAATEDLERNRTRASTATQRAAKQKKRVDAARKRADQLIGKQEKLLATAQSDVVSLLAAEETRRIAAEARAVAAAVKKREDAAKKQLAVRREQERVARERATADAREKRNEKRKLPRLAASPPPTTKAPRKSEKKPTSPTSTISTPTSTISVVREIPASQIETDEPIANEPTTEELAAEAGIESGAPSSPGSETAVQIAMSQLGKAYVWGATGPVAFDCSGLTSYAWAKAGKRLPRTSRMQYTATRRVSRTELQPGDLLFFAKPGRPIHHVAMYIGNGQMVEAPHRKARVRVRSMNRRDYVGAGRVG